MRLEVTPQTRPTVLLVACTDRPGLAHAITGVRFRHGANIVGNQEFVDEGSRRFFMCAAFDGAADHEVVHSSSATTRCTVLGATCGKSGRS